MNDRRARFEAQALPHLDAAYNLARWLSRSPTDADDIVQEAMLRAFRAFDGVRGDTVRPWLLAIVRNCFHDHAGRAARLQPLDDHGVERMRDEAPDPEDQAAWSSERRRLDLMLARLPDDYREALILREMEDMSYRQIAEATGAPIGTVMSRLARARALLKDQMRAQEDGDELR
ncbi:MAG: sigma-70 family RNA polymerase sigma factor [Caulobacteraceae bacterium]